MLAAIRLAFSGVQREGGITLHEAAAIDDYAGPEARLSARAKDVDTCWQEVPSEHIAQHGSVFSFLDDIGRVYYLPAYMCWLVRVGNATQSNSVDGLLFTLQAGTEWSRLLTPAQCAAVAQFLAYVHEVVEERWELSAAKESLDAYWARFLPPRVSLEPLTIAELRSLAESTPVARFGAAPAGALPPPHVAARAIRQLEEGVPAFWCVPFLIIDDAHGTVLGGCTFKGAPANGEVEIAYGVATAQRGRGIATQAVRALLALASGERSVLRVVAEIVTSNTASSRLVSRLGFTAGAPFVDADGETVARWTIALPR